MVSVTPAPVTRARGPRIVVGTTGPRLGRPARPALLPGGHRDELVVVEAITERPLALLRGAVVDRMSWVLNGIGDLTWSMSSFDPVLLSCLVDRATIATDLDGQSGELMLLGREVQWWRDGVLHWAGVPVQADVGADGVVRFQAWDLGWYLTRRFFGAAERYDLLDGAGSMDRAGLPGWKRNGTVVATRDTGTKVRGVGSARLDGTGTIVRTFEHPGPVGGQTLTVHLTWQAWVPTSTPVDTPIATIEVRNTRNGPVVDSETVRVDEGTRTGTWEQGAAYALLKPGGRRYVTVRLHSRTGHGDWLFDDVRALKNDTTGIPEGADLATHAIAALNHFQNARGKGTFGFRPFKVSNSGTVEPMGVRHVEHQQALDYLRTLTDRADGIDWWIEPRTRRFCVGHRRGVDHTNFQFHERNTTGGWGHDEQTRNSAVVTLGEASGPDRAEGSYVDASKIRGLILEEAISPPARTPLSALDPMAAQVWGQTSDAQITPDGLAVSSDWLGDIGPGDRLPTSRRSGMLRARPETRIQTLTLDLATERLVAS